MSPASRTIEVTITANTRPLQAALMRAEVAVTRQWWRRLALRFALWRLDR